MKYYRYLRFLAMVLLGSGCEPPGVPMASDAGQGSDAGPGRDCYDEESCGFEFWKDCGDKPICECGPACAGKPVQITVGSDHSCLRYDTGGVLCWGMLRGVESDPSAYRADDGVYITPPEPRRPAIAPPTGISDALSIASGDFHTCVLRKDRTVWCWGRNNHGQLGLDYSHDELYGYERVEHKLPAPVPELDNVTAICAGNGSTGGAQNNDRGFGVAGGIFWGEPGSSIGCGAGDGFGCLIKPDHTLLCWGENRDGQLGDGTGDVRHRTGYSIPPEVLNEVVSVDGGFGHACALRMNGELWCWGSNRGGELGNGSVTETLEPPRKVPGLGLVVDFSVDSHMTCAVVLGGQLYCWGGDWTNLMGTNDPFAAVPAPLAIKGEEHTRAIAVGNYHGCLIRENDEVACWGGDDSGATGPHPMHVQQSGQRQVIEELPRPPRPAVAAASAP